jgi:hypothetical protein
MQKLYREDPSTVARFIREGEPWLEDHPFSASAEDVKTIYFTLWGTCLQISLSLQWTLPNHTIRADDILVAITGREIDNRIKRWKKKTTPGTDGVETKHLQWANVKKALQYFYNLLFISGLQPTDRRNNRTTFIPKPGRDLRQAENYRPITIGSLLGRIYWGILDNRLRGQTAFSPTRKDLFTSQAVSIMSIFLMNYYATLRCATE